MLRMSVRFLNFFIFGHKNILRYNGVPPAIFSLFVGVSIFSIERVKSFFRTIKEEFVVF